MSPSTLQTLRLLRFPALLAAGLVLAYGIWAAVIDAAGPNQLIVPVMVDHTAKVELFYDIGHGIRQEDSASEILPVADDLREVSFPVPRLPIVAMRFDPMDGAGRFTIGQPRLETASGRFVAKFPMSAIIPANQIASYKVEGKQWSGATLAEANDPQLTLALGGPLRVGQPRTPWIEGGVFLAVAFAAWRMKKKPAKEI